MLTTTYPKRVMEARELQIGDIVELVSDVKSPFSAKIVRQMDDGIIHFFRPYGTTADFFYTGGVICYTGVENHCITQNSSEKYFVFERHEEYSEEKGGVREPGKNIKTILEELSDKIVELESKIGESEKKMRGMARLSPNWYR